MSEVRIVGDSPKGVSRRSFVKGAITAAISVIAATSFGLFVTSTVAKAKEYIARRSGGLYAIDSARTVRKSNENQEVLTLYKEYLSPGTVRPAYTELSHRLLHTTYGDQVDAHIRKLRSTSVEEAKEETKQEVAKLLSSQAKA